MTKVRMRVYCESSSEDSTTKPNDPPPLAITLLPMLLVMISRQFLKLTVRPWLSVNLHEKECAHTLECVQCVCVSNTLMQHWCYRQQDGNSF